MPNIKTLLPDGPAIISLSPGIKEPDAANELMFSTARDIQANRVFISGPGSIPSIVWAARCGAVVTSWSDNVNWANSVQETFDLAGIPQPTVHLQAGFDQIKTQSCDRALIHLLRGKALQLEQLQLAAAVLKVGGKLVFVGAKNEGVKSALKAAKAIFNYAGIVAQKGGYHAGMAQRPPGDYPLPTLNYFQDEIVVQGKSTILISCPGVFAPRRLDGGARALIESMELTSEKSILDMGCGTGLVGLTALRKGADVTLSDVSARAVICAQRTLQANGFHAPVIHTSGAEAFDASTFDAVFVNPPFHKGYGVDYETTRYLLEQAVHALRSQGSLYLVANTFLKYGPWIQKSFENVHIIYDNNQFRVWQGIKA
jgi:16S rRNA (guanine1207-N2)-methyltransferase